MRYQLIYVYSIATTEGKARLSSAGPPTQRMGRSSSKFMGAPKNPLQELQLKESKMAQRKRNLENEQQKIAKLQEKQAKKNKKNQKRQAKKNKKNQKRHSKTCPPRNSQTKRPSDGQRPAGSFDLQSMRHEIRQEQQLLQFESKMQADLDGELNVFLINQIANSMEFFANYDSEITATSEDLLAKENEFNQHLEEHSIFLGNPLDVAINKWMQFQPYHGPGKNHSQPLQPQALYVVFENIDIARPNDANYDSISPLCKVNMETDCYNTTPCKEDYVDMLREIKWKGYVRLKLREEPKAQPHIDEVYTDGSSGYSTNSGYSTKAPSIASSIYSSEPHYDYTYIAHINKHHPLSELKMGSQRDKWQLDAKVLPETCISTLGNYIEACIVADSDDETDDERSHDDGEDGYSSDDEAEVRRHQDYETIQAIRQYKIEQERRKLLLQQRYLNSKAFMCYFGELMRQKLSEQLGIARADLDSGTYRGSSIYTKHYEIIPAIHVAHNAQNWPDCAFQFRIRERPIVTNPLTGQQIQWPTRAMIKRMETFGFHVVPMGYAPKKDRNPFRELEWRIAFPKAERYLEQHLTSAQVKVLMMAKALVKTFVEPQEKHKALMFVVDQLRMHLFWECERNFTAWPEEFLGEVLVRFISTFMQRLREKCLRDYFIQERNLFESIPEYSLVTLYSILADITANPLMHLMVAFRNINGADNFFPKLNFKKVYLNLREHDLMKLKVLSKNARNLMGTDAAKEEPLLLVDEGAMGLVGMKQHREKTNGRLRRKTQVLRHTIEVKKKQDYEARRLSVESIDVEYFFNNSMFNAHPHRVNQGLENLRRTNILEILLDHFLEMTKKAILLQTIHLAKIYLNRLMILCKFYHNYGCDMGAKEYMASIQQLQEEVNNAHKDGDFSLEPPALPIRTSVEPPRSYQAQDFFRSVSPELMRLRRVTPSVENTSMQSMRSISSYETKDIEKTVMSPENSSMVTSTYEKLNVYVEVVPDLAINTKQETPSSRRSTISKQRRASVRNCEEVSENHCYGTDSPETTRSIKFKEYVVEVHEGYTNPIQKPEGYLPVSILRLDHEALDEHIDVSAATSEQSFADEPAASSPEKSQGQMHALLNRFGTAGGILKSSPLGSSKVLKSIATSTERMLSSATVTETREHFRDVLQRKTVQLKGAFNDSSDS